MTDPLPHFPGAESMLGRWIPEGADHGPDPVTGFRVKQVTSQLSMATCVYGEDPPSSTVCNRIVIQRMAYGRVRGPVEVWVYDLDTDLSQLIDFDASHVERGNYAYGDHFFYFRHSTGTRELIRLTLSTLERVVVHVLPDDHPGFVGSGTASPDGRYYTNKIRGDDNVYHIVLVDLHDGSHRVVASGEDLCNAHVCFDRVDGNTIFVQQNRGQRLGSNGMIETVDPTPGATLFLVDLTTGERTELPIAPPHFPRSITGHEAWIKGEHAFVFSCVGGGSAVEMDGKRGNLLVYRIGDEGPTLIADDPDAYHGHVSTSECGRFWVNDRFTKEGIFIAVGSIRTGKWTDLCQMGGHMLRAEVGHAHPYMAADRSRVFFGSTRTGIPQVFAVMIPDGLLDDLDRDD